MAETITIDMNVLANNVRTGNYPDVPRIKEERLTLMTESLIANFSIIMGQCLLNGIESDNAEVIYPKRAKLFDELMMIVVTGNYGRTNRLVAAIENLCNESLNDADCWPSRRQAINITTFATEYFAWDDHTRSVFFNNNQELVSPKVDESTDVEEAKEVVINCNE